MLGALAALSFLSFMGKVNHKFSFPSFYIFWYLDYFLYWVHYYEICEKPDSFLLEGVNTAWSMWCMLKMYGHYHHRHHHRHHHHHHHHHNHQHHIPVSSRAFGEKVSHLWVKNFGLTPAHACGTISHTWLKGLSCYKLKAMQTNEGGHFNGSASPEFSGFWREKY